MKKTLAILLAAMMLFSMAACSTDEESPPPDSDSSRVSQNDGYSTDESSTLPTGIDLPADKYPWLDGLVLPDDAVITSIDDEYYEEDGFLTLYIRPMDTEKANAYLEKLRTAGYTDDPVAGLNSPNRKYDLVVGTSFVDLGYISLTLYDRSDPAQQWNNPQYIQYTSGIEQPSFTFVINGELMGQLVIHAEATVEEIDAWKQSLLNAGFEEYREGEQWGISNATYNIQMNGFVDGIAYIYIGLV